MGTRAGWGQGSGSSVGSSHNQYPTDSDPMDSDPTDSDIVSLRVCT